MKINVVAKTLQAHLLKFFRPVLQVRFMGEEVVILKFILLCVFVSEPLSQLHILKIFTKLICQPPRQLFLGDS